MQTKKTATYLTLAASLICGTVLGQEVPQTATKHSTEKSGKIARAAQSHKSKSKTPISASALTSMRPLNPELSQAIGDSFNFSRAGDAAVNRGAWQEASSDYQQALGLAPANRPALYGMAKCAEKSGDTKSAINYYRAAIYTSEPGRYGTVQDDGFQENMPEKLMEYALLLSKTGQEQESLFVCRRAVSLLNYDNGKPDLKVMLPDFTAEDFAYTPKHLQAIAHLTIGIVASGHGETNALPELIQAIFLAPKRRLQVSTLANISMGRVSREQRRLFSRPFS